MNIRTEHILYMRHSCSGHYTFIIFYSLQKESCKIVTFEKTLIDKKIKAA